MLRLTGCVWGVMCFGAIALGGVDVPNGSFEQGDEAPTGWTLHGDGRWVDRAATDGRRAIAVTGAGDDTSAWHSDAIALEPDRVYQVRFDARATEGATGSIVTGPTYANRDLRVGAESWKTVKSIFVTPDRDGPVSTHLRFGQWHASGRFLFDAVSLRPVQPVYRLVDGQLLGAGESFEANTYRFVAPMQAASSNQSRPLLRHDCGYNTNRWTLGGDSVVVYRHAIGRRQTRAVVRAAVVYHVRGSLVVSASADGRTWRELGTIDGVASGEFDVPADLLPADALHVRFTTRASADGSPSLQLGDYQYEATFAGPPRRGVGETRYAAIESADPRLAWSIQRIGDGLPGADNTITLTIENQSDQPLRITPRAVVANDRARRAFEADPVTLNPGENTVAFDYDVPDAGEWTLRLELAGDAEAAATISLRVPALYAASFGRSLPGSSPQADLWWASSGWKISRRRPAPQARSQTLRITAAANEAEAAQLVVRPVRPIEALTVTCGDLENEQGRRLPAAAIELLRVMYVNVTHPTDRVGCIGHWPDPLPPLTGPIDLPAGANQPLWVRVKPPKGTPAGEYRGVIRLRGKDYAADVPLRVTVYGFELPDRMTCETAFGLRPAAIWRYHNLTDEDDRRAVLEKYLKNFADHHIAPYDPAPMDPLVVDWVNQPEWLGGHRDPEVHHEGDHALRLHDEDETRNVQATYHQLIPIPEGGLKLAFWYRTAEPGQSMIVSIMHHDADGQWMSGRNNDITLAGDGQWQRFEQTVTRFPQGAARARLVLWATRFREDGAYTGTVWYDQVTLTDAATGEALITGGGFEPDPERMPRAELNTDAWDRAMTRAVDVHHFNTFRLRVHGLGGGTFHERYEPTLLGFAEDTPQYRAAMRSYLGQLEAHLRKRGWLDEAFVYWFDEPAPRDYDFVMNGFDKLRRWAPGLRRMLTEQVEPELVGGPTLWCPVSSNFQPDLAAERQRAGDEFWWYVCTGPKAPYATLFIDHPATELRVWLWQTWRRDIRGILVWSANYWTSSAAYPDPDRPQNPYADPMGWVSGYSTPDAVRRPWGNGDGRFVYPPLAAADADPAAPVLEGPVDSIRWEMLRDGIEDYEYLAMLQRLLNQHAAALTDAQRQQYETLLTVPDDITATMTRFTTDPAPIQARRHVLARALAELSAMTAKRP